MPDPDFFLKTHDTRSAIAQTLEDTNGNAVDITGGTVRFLMRPIGGTVNKVSGTATVTDGSAGSVSYSWSSGDTDTAGMFLAEWEVTFPTAAKQTFPNAGYVLVRIEDDLG